MAPSGCPETAQSRLNSGFCSASMAPPTSGFGIVMHPHMQRVIQSSASLNEDAACQRPQQVTQYNYPSRRQQAFQNGVSAPLIDVREDAGNMVPALPKQDPQLGQFFQSFLQETMAAGVASNLMRYNSAPSSMQGSLTGLGNSILNGDVERRQFFSNSVLHPDSKNSADSSHEALRKAGTSSADSANHLSNHGAALPSPCASYHHGFHNNNGKFLSQMGMETEGPPDGLAEAGRTGLEVPSSYHLKGSFAPNSAQLESENGVVHGAATSKSALLRHSSSPAGFLLQLNDDHERHLLGSSSGNSSEEGSYERQEGPAYPGNFAWGEAGNGVIGSPTAAYAPRKRTRDLEERGYPQKADGLEHGVLGNYSGLPSSTSPENTYLADKLSPDSIPCRTRAKRGCATHPRSISERVRRTKISERMKKLQDLVPNMDKQTNTCEMLDEAIEYVKHLQRQVQELTERRSKCECSCGAKETSSK